MGDPPFYQFFKEIPPSNFLTSIDFDFTTIFIIIQIAGPRCKLHLQVVLSSEPQKHSNGKNQYTHMKSK